MPRLHRLPPTTCAFHLGFSLGATLFIFKASVEVQGSLRAVQTIVTAWAAATYLLSLFQTNRTLFPPPPSPREPEADVQLLGQAESNHDALVPSKQVDIHLGEMFALVIFAAVTVGLSLLSLPPGVKTWTRLLVDMFAIVVSSVIIFLLVHIQDLQRERDDAKLELLDSSSGTGHPWYLVRFPDTVRRSFDQWLSVVVGTAIMATYVGLLGQKWLGWFS